VLPVAQSQVGAYGLPRDLARAEAYLTAGADGGDAAASRNLGLLLLELNR
jgi:TPR repeat protein